MKMAQFCTRAIQRSYYQPNYNLPDAEPDGSANSSKDNGAFNGLKVIKSAKSARRLP